MADEESFGVIDYCIFSLVLLTSLSIGVYHAVTGGRQRTNKEYLLANRNLSTLPVALSILVSFVSGILVLGTPAEMYTYGTQLMMRLLGYCMACVISSRLLVPLFFSLRVTSSFEYLERRFKSKLVKLIGTVGMLVGNLFYMGLVVFTPAVALEAVTGFPLWASICATAVVATVYTTLGGLKAVIWTDVFQAVVMVVGMLAIVIVGLYRVGGATRVWNLNYAHERIEFFNFNPDPTIRLSFWSTVFGGLFSTLTIFGVGQTSVQRYCSLPTLRQARNSVYLNIPFLVLVNALAAGTGLVMFAYYADIGCDPIKDKKISSSNQLLPYFVITVLRDIPGLPGAFLAVLFSGALSSLSSSLNSAAAVTWQDILQYIITGKQVKESHKVFITKATVFIYGVITIFIALASQKLGVHVLQASMSFTGATMGPTLGMFLLGALFRRANYIGAAVGCGISAVISLWLAIGAFIVRPRYQGLPTLTHNCSSNQSLFNDDFTYITTTPDWSLSSVNLTLATPPQSYQVNKFYEISFLWYSFIGCAITIIIGLIVSHITNLISPASLADEPDSSLIISLREGLCCCLASKSQYKLPPLNSVHPQSNGATGHEVGQRDVTKNNEQELQDVKPSQLLEDVKCERVRSSGRTASERI